MKTSPFVLGLVVTLLILDVWAPFIAAVVGACVMLWAAFSERPRPEIVLLAILLLTDISGIRLDLLVPSAVRLFGLPLLSLSIILSLAVLAVRNRRKRFLALTPVLAALSLAAAGATSPSAVLSSDLLVALVSTMLAALAIPAGRDSLPGVLNAISIGVVGKATQILAMQALGLGLQQGVLARASFDSYWLVAPIAFAAIGAAAHHRPRLWAANVTITSAIVLSLTRQAWIGLALAFAVLPFLAERRRSIRAYFGPLALILVLAAGGAFVSARSSSSFVYVDRFILLTEQVADTPERAVERDTRFHELDAVVDILIQDPVHLVAGAGFGSTFSLDPTVVASLSDSAYPSSQRRANEFPKTHVRVVNIAFKSGLLGLAFVLSFLILIYRRTGKFPAPSARVYSVILGLPAVLLALNAWTLKQDVALGMLLGSILQGSHYYEQSTKRDPPRTHAGSTLPT